MSNPSGDKGTKAETAIVKWLQVNGYPFADRRTKKGSNDRGDILPCPGVIVESKAYKLPTGVPTAGQVVEWMRQTEVERDNARADIGVLIVKRNGTTDVGRWFAYVTAWTLAELVTGTSHGALGSPALHAPVCLAVADLVLLLRTAGWGDEIEVES